MPYLYDLTDTWNNAGTVFNGIKLNVTDTASSASSLLMNLQVGGSSKVTIGKTGFINTAFGGGIRIYDNGGVLGVNDTSSLLAMFGGELYIDNNHTGGFRFRTNFSTHTCCTMYKSSNPVSAEFNTSISLGSNTYLTFDANDTFAQRRSTNAQAFRIYNAFTDASNYDRGFMRWTSNVLEIGTERAGTYSTTRNLAFVFQGATVGVITNNGGFWFGSSNSSGDKACVITGQFSSASAFCSSVIAGERGTADLMGKCVVAYAGRPFNAGNYVGGVCQSFIMTLSGYTTGTGQSRMRGGQDGAIWDNGQRITVRSGYTISALVCIKGIKSDGTAIARFWRLVDITRVGNTTTLDVAAQTIGTDHNPSACTITIQADDTNEALEILVGGVAAETWRWTGTIYATEMAYGT